MDALEVTYLLARAEADTMAIVARPGWAENTKYLLADEKQKNRELVGVFVNRIRQLSAGQVLPREIVNTDMWLAPRVPDTSRYLFARLTDAWKELIVGQQHIGMSPAAQEKQEFDAMLADARKASADLETPTNAAQYLATLGESVLGMVARMEEKNESRNAG